MCYVTLRGLVYFGASIHVYHGIQLMLSMCYHLFSDSVSREDYYVSRVDIIFNWCFLVLGIFIFRGVEQQSKTFIRWPTVGFTLLLAARFIVELLKQYQWEREEIYQTLKTLGPFTYTNMSIDVDPLISAAVGIYIFILFVYNHSLEYSPDGHHLHSNDTSHRRNSDNLPFHHSNSISTPNGGHHRQGYHCRNNSTSGYPSDSSDTTRLLPANNGSNQGDANNNNTSNSALINISGSGGGNSNGPIHGVTAVPNPLYEYDQAIRMMDARRPPPPRPHLIEHHHSHCTLQYKVESV